MPARHPEDKLDTGLISQGYYIVESYEEPTLLGQNEVCGFASLMATAYSAAVRDQRFHSTVIASAGKHAKEHICELASSPASVVSKTLGQDIGLESRAYYNPVI